MSIFGYLNTTIITLLAHALARHSTAVIFALQTCQTPEPVSFPEQTLGSGTEVSQPPVQKYGTVCRLHSDSPA